MTGCQYGQYRNLQAEDLNRQLFDHFIRRQIVTRCWRRESGEWLIRDVPFVDDWSEEDYRQLLEHLSGILASGGFVYAAFVRGELKGFVSVDAVWLDPEREYLDLTNLHVSQELRGRGIGRELFRAAAQWAREQGAKKLYLSAHSSVESQAFYRAMGCVEAETYSRKHVEAEPCDCQMECRL